MKIIIDADATPREAIEICREAAEKYILELWTVASFNHRMDSANHITVGDSPQEADLKIVNITSGGDLVVTQDYGLAALILARGAVAISPWGKIYRPETIDFLLEERDVKARYRRGGGKTRGPAKRNGNDNINFRRNLFKAIENLIGQTGGQDDP